MSLERDLIWRAQQLLLTTNAEFICIALRRLAYRYPLLAPAAEALTARIVAGLDGEHTFDNWCEEQGLRLTRDQLLLARLAWLDKLLESYP